MIEPQSTQPASTSAAPSASGEPTHVPPQAPASSGPQSVAPAREVSPAAPTPAPVDRLSTLMAGTVEPDAVASHLPLNPETLAKLSPAEQQRLQETVERRVTEEAQKIAARTIEEASGLDLTRHSDSVGDVRPIPLPAAASTRAYDLAAIAREGEERAYRQGLDRVIDEVARAEGVTPTASQRAAVHDARPALDAKVHAAVRELVGKG
jgi:hypothetical protein